MSPSVMMVLSWFESGMFSTVLKLQGTSFQFHDPINSMLFYSCIILSFFQDACHFCHWVDHLATAEVMLCFVSLPQNATYLLIFPSQRRWLMILQQIRSVERSIRMEIKFMPMK